MKNQILLVFLASLLLPISFVNGQQTGTSNKEAPSKTSTTEDLNSSASDERATEEKIVISDKSLATVDILQLKAKFEKKLEAYKKQNETSQEEFHQLIEKYQSQGVSYSTFRKTWRNFAYKALNFPDSIPIYKSLEKIIDQAPSETENQENLTQNMRGQFYQLIENDRHKIYLQLKKLNLLRSKVLKNNLAKKSLHIFGKHSGAFEDVQLETRLVSYQYKSLIAQKVSLLRKNFYGGFWGITEIIKELVIILFVFSLPFIFYSLFLKFSDYLETKQREFFRKGYREPNYRVVAQWIQRINPFLPWIFIFVLIKICEKLLLSTNVYEFFIMFSPFVSLYAIYRLFRILIEISLTKVLQSIGATNKKDLRTRLVSTSKFIGLYFFWLFCILYSAENAVNKGLIFIQVKAFSYWVSFFVLSYAFSKWKNEIADYIAHINSHFVFQKTISLVPK